MKYILFVCTGNACRSAAAECIMRKMLADKGVSDIEAGSVGTLDWGENPRDSRMKKVAKEKGYALEGTTEYMSSEKLDRADLIIVMTQRHKDQVTSLLKFSHWNRIHLFSEYCFGTDEEIPDPHAQPLEIYEKVFEQIEKGVAQMLQRVVKKG